MDEIHNPDVVDTLTPASMDRAENLLQKGRAAEEAGDQETLAAITSEITRDPSFGSAVRDRMETGDLQPSDPDDVRQKKEEDTGAELLEAQQRLSKVVDEVKSLYAELIRAAIAGRSVAVTYDSLGEQSEQELRGVVSRVDSLLNAGSSQDIADAMRALNVDTVIESTTARIRSLVGYFGGSMPDQLRSQAMILDKIKGTSESLKAANANLQKLQATT